MKQIPNAALKDVSNSVCKIKIGINNVLHLTSHKLTFYITMKQKFRHIKVFYVTYPIFCIIPVRAYSFQYCFSILIHAFLLVNYEDNVPDILEIVMIQAQY